MALSEAEANMQAMADNPYLGRFVAVGKMENGDYVQMWGITARSDNSQNRKIIPDMGKLKTDAVDWDRVKDPSNIIYTGMRDYHGQLFVVSNGDQTDSVIDNMYYNHPLRGHTFHEYDQALKHRRDEGPGTKFTPRVTEITDTRTGEHIFSNITRATQNPRDSDRPIHSYHRVEVENGEGFYTRTYLEGTEDLPTYRGQPIPIAFWGTLDDIFKTYWMIIDGPNAVALAVRRFNGKGLIEDKYDSKPYPHDI